MHTRVHPGNILAMGDQIKLSSDSLSPKDEMPGIMAKSEGFAAPEWGSVAATAAQDIWSLGASIVAALTQKPPVIREDGALELGSHVQEPLAGIAREALKAEAEKRISGYGEWYFESVWEPWSHRRTASLLFSSALHPLS